MIDTLCLTPVTPAFGRGFARYVANPGDRLLWGMVLLFGGGALLSLLLSRAAKAADPDRH